MKEFYSNGKLLISGEYLVLDGALSLAVPTKKGQSLQARPLDASILKWTSLDHQGQVWFEGAFRIEKKENTLDIIPLSGEGLNYRGVTETLVRLLSEAHRLRPSFLLEEAGYEVITQLDFDPAWGLGSSSTLINNIAQWAEVDPYILLWNAFSGSGYDIACAQHDQPITYQLNNKEPKATPVTFEPSFKDQLFFVHLNAKQNSREGIARYREYTGDLASSIAAISNITEKLSKATSLSSFESLLDEHEQLIASIIKLPTVKERLFDAYPHSIKSLGAWGGDFVLATGASDLVFDYFAKKGFKTIVPYSEMVK